MAEFLEERLPVGVRMGASYGDEYAVEITENAAGAEFRRLVTPFPKRRWSVEYTQATSALWDNVVALYHRAYGTYAGFRVHCIDDNSTNGRAGQPTATDQVLALVSAGVYQLQKSTAPGPPRWPWAAQAHPLQSRWPVRHSSRLPISPSGMPTGPSIQPPDASRMPPISRESSRESARPPRPSSP